MLISSQTHECESPFSMITKHTPQCSVLLHKHVASADNAPETDLLIVQGGEPKFSTGFMTQRNQQWLLLLPDKVLTPISVLSYCCAVKSMLKTINLVKTFVSSIKT